MSLIGAACIRLGPFDSHGVQPSTSEVDAAIRAIIAAKQKELAKAKKSLRSSRREDAKQRNQALVEKIEGEIAAEEAKLG